MSKKKRYVKNDIDKYRELEASQSLSMYKDIEDKYGKYKDDPSIGNMYQREKKTMKPKKRAMIKKDCGCRK